MKTTIVFFRLMLAAAVVTVSYLAITPVDVPVVEDLNDKVGHILAFSTLAFLLDYSFPESRPGPTKIALLLGYGLLIEVVQYFLQYRTFSLLDWMADAVGIALYLLILPALRHFPLLRWREGNSR